MLAGLVFVALALFLFVVPLSLAEWYRLTRLVLLVLGAVLILLGLVLALRGIRFPRDNPHALAMARFLEQFLDYRYTFIRNIGRRELGYVDAVLVGPNGILVFYFFARKGAFYTERNVWFERRGQSLEPLKENPTREAVKDVNALREFLARRRLSSVPVYAVIVVTDPQTAITAQQPIVPVAHMHNVQMALQSNYLAAERIRPPESAAVVRAIMEDVA
ncbi:MAG: hypothetical protein Kow0077_05980 [Anaerolineae bacterium]